MTQLAAIPLDDVTLDLIEHSLDAVYEVDEDGAYRVVGAEFTINALLDFWSGYDRGKVIDTGHTVDGRDLVEYPDPIYTRDDLVRALVSEVRRLRGSVHREVEGDR